jgi:hypothetical protein
MPHHSNIFRVVEGICQCIRIIQIEKGEHDSLHVFNKDLGQISNPSFDLGHWTWHRRGLFHSYIVKKGRVFRQPRAYLARPIPLKWHGLLPTDFLHDWKDVWYKERLQKEAAFLWSIYHMSLQLIPNAIEVFLGFLKISLATTPA